ncbi:MAG: amidinotransferase [Candidatus Dormibacteraeota bacterium]|nr:amidinotransferase [Candidatus Dormibacteraeota bacterium]
MAILMCRPDFFGIEYEINPWMRVAVSVDRDLAATQWNSLVATYTRLGADVTLAEPRPGLPDMVFSANAAVIWNGAAVLSNFHHAERRGEEPFWRQELEQRGLTVTDLDRSLSFEGAGDALFVGSRLFCGYGFRTDRDAHAAVGRALGVDVVSLELVDPRFYHLDTCFCPLNERTVLFAPDAMTPASARLVRQLVPHVIQVPLDVAAGFACNAMPVGGSVVSSLAATRLEEPLADAGFATVELPMSEFMKSGGGVRCLSLPLDAGSA